MGNGAANSGFFGALANASTSLRAAGARLMSTPAGVLPFIGARPTGAKGNSLASASAAQSERIRMRMLRSDDNFAEIAKIAEAATDTEVVRAAMRELAIASDEHRAEVLPLLTALGESGSCASLSAIITLLNIDAFKEASQIFRRKVSSGQLSEMLVDGKAKLFHVIDISSCLDRIFRTNDAPALFTALISMLSIDRQAHAVSEMFGDTEPGGYRYIHDQNGIPSELKLLALQMMQVLPQAVRERPLWYATREEDEVVAYNATVSLITYWQGEGRVPAHLDPFSMLDVGLLFYLSTLAATFKWRSTVDMVALHQAEAELNEQLAAMAQDSPIARRLEDEIDELRLRLRRETEARLSSLQPIVNEITKALNLPFAKLEVTDDIGCAAYALGTGTILLNRRTVMDERPLGEDVMSSLLHELCHMGQDVLLIRMICDDLNLVFGQHGQLLVSLWDRYSDIMGYAPDHIFLLAVLRLRGDQQLDSVERERGKRLVAAANRANVTQHQKKFIAMRFRHLISSYEALASGEHDGQLLGCLRDLNQLQGMFDAGRIPEILLYELQKCRTELEAIVQPFAGQVQGAKDFVAVAELVFQSEFREYVEPICVKVRQLLLETLDEELQALQRIEARVVRMGYHEDEAYTVSDRVEVIVRAILRGWYA